MDFRKLQNRWWIISSCVQDKALVYYDRFAFIVAFTIAVPVGLVIGIVERVQRIPELYYALKKNGELRRKNIEDYGYFYPPLDKDD